MISLWTCGFTSVSHHWSASASRQESPQTPLYDRRAPARHIQPVCQRHGNLPTRLWQWQWLYRLCWSLWQCCSVRGRSLVVRCWELQLEQVVLWRSRKPWTPQLNLILSHVERVHAALGRKETCHTVKWHSVFFTWFNPCNVKSQSYYHFILESTKPMLSSTGLFSQVLTIDLEAGSASGAFQEGWWWRGRGSSLHPPPSHSWSLWSCCAVHHLSPPLCLWSREITVEPERSVKVTYLSPSIVCFSHSTCTTFSDCRIWHLRRASSPTASSTISTDWDYRC